MSNQTQTQKTDWRKLIAVVTAGVVLPTVGQWAQNCMGDVCAPFTVGNVIGPAVPSLLTAATTLVAFFMTPKKK